jgi:hypothetical protein
MVQTDSQLADVFAETTDRGAPDPATLRPAVERQLNAVIIEAANEERACRRQMRNWNVVDVVLGLAAALLAAAAGGVVLTTNEQVPVAGGMALASALCSAGYTTLRAAQRSEKLARILEGWINLGGSANQHLAFDLPQDEWLLGRAKEDLGRLNARRAMLVAGKIEDATPGPP